MPTSKYPKDERKLDRNEQDRLFSHGLHEDTIFNDRLNFFLVFESVLFATFATVYASERTVPDAALPILAAIGFAMTVMWVYVQRHQHIMLDVLVYRAEQHVLEYAETRALVKSRRRWNLSAGALLTYAIPATVLLVWVVLFWAGFTRERSSLKMPPNKHQVSTNRGPTSR